MPEIRNFLRYWMPVIAWTIVIIGVTTMPGKTAASVSGGVPFVSVLAHFGEFLVFSFLLHRAVFSGAKTSARTALFLTIAVSFIFSILTEIMQLYVPGRFFDYGDMLTNDVGALVGLGRSIYAVAA